MAGKAVSVSLITEPNPVPNPEKDPIPLYIRGPIPGFDIKMNTVGTLGPTDLQEILDELFNLFDSLSDRVTALETP